MRTLLICLIVFWFNAGAHAAAAANPDQQKLEFAPADQEAPSSSSSYLPVAIGIGLLIVLALGAGAVLAMRTPNRDIEVNQRRIAIVVLGGATGLVVALLGVVYALRWQESIVRWVNDGDLKEARWVLAALAIVLAGLALMFVSMQPARAEERKSVILRRLLYGTNTLLTGLLVLLLLAVVNVMVFLKLPENVITTAAGFKGLGDTSKDFLLSIKEPVKLYLIMPQDYVMETQQDRYASLYADCKALLDAVESDNKNVKAYFLSPATDDAEIKQVMSRYKIPEARRGQFGLLVAYGETDDLFEFITARELVTFMRVSSDPRNPSFVPAFQGENRLMTGLKFLSGGAKRPVVYFTQGHGEPAIVQAPKQSDSRSAFSLVEHLKDRKFDVKPLYFEPGKEPNLSDATIVVVAAPTKPFGPEEARIITNYMAPRKSGPTGTLVAMLPAFPGPDGQVSTTGLEPLLINLGVRSDELRLFSMPKPSFTRIFSPKLVPGAFTREVQMSNSPLNRLLGETDYILFSNVRPMRYERTPSEVFSGVNLFSTGRDWETYRDKNYNSNPDEILALIEKENKQNLNPTANEKQVTRNEVPFGVLVVETYGEGDNMRQRPCALVVGSDSFISDEAIQQSRSPNLNIAMMGALLDFIRERPEGMNIAPRALGTFEMPQKPDNVVLLYLPFGAIVLGIAALGVGVWYTRRT